VLALDLMPIAYLYCTIVSRCQVITPTLSMEVIVIMIATHVHGEIFILREIFRMSIMMKLIVISKFLKRYSKAKRTRSPAYSRTPRRIKEGFPKGGQEKLRSRRGQSSC